jgi:hypothetical protein
MPLFDIWYWHVRATTQDRPEAALWLMWPRKEARRANYLPLQHPVQPDINGRMVARRVSWGPQQRRDSSEHADQNLEDLCSELARTRNSRPNGISPSSSVAAAPIDRNCAQKHAETELPAAVSEIRMRVCWPSGGV